MKTTLGVFTAILLAGIIYVQPVHAQVQVQPGPGFSVQIGPDGRGASNASILALANNWASLGRPCYVTVLTANQIASFLIQGAFNSIPILRTSLMMPEVFLPEHPFMGTRHLLLSERLPLKDRFH